MKSTGTVADICSLQWHNLSGLEKYYRFTILIDAKATCRRFCGYIRCKSSHNSYNLAFYFLAEQKIQTCMYNSTDNWESVLVHNLMTTLYMFTPRNGTTMLPRYLKGCFCLWDKRSGWVNQLQTRIKKHYLKKKEKQSCNFPKIIWVSASQNYKMTEWKNLSR